MANNSGNKRAVGSDTPQRQRRQLNRFDNDNEWWWEIENEDLILNLSPFNMPDNLLQQTTATTTTAAATTTATTTTATTSAVANSAEVEESVMNRLLRKRDEFAKKNSGEEKRAEQADNEFNDTELVADDVSARENKVQSLEEFKADLRLKRLARQTAVQDLRTEIHTLRSRLAQAGLATDDVYVSAATGDSATSDEQEMSSSRHANIELANVQLALQMANSENLSLRTQVGVVNKQVDALKEVVSCCKQMLVFKEEQCTQLKTKLDEIESSLAERELNLMSSDLRVEYERQLGNIRQLRELYEERQRISAAEHENLQRLISIKRDELKTEQTNLEERNASLLKDLEKTEEELGDLREECNEHNCEKKTLKEEMGAVNMLFSQMITESNGRDNLDIDRLTMMLEENRTLLNDMATKEIANDGATLPKLLFELVEEAAVASGDARNSTCSTSSLLNA